MMTQQMLFCDFEWDEPDGCTTPRGWVHLLNHPDYQDEYSRHDCCGNYLTYPTTRGPNGETVHACAYVMRSEPLTGNTHTVGNRAAWFHGIGEAKRWIEEQVKRYFGAPTEEQP